MTIQNSKLKILNSGKGFTMVELIITIALLSLGITGIYSAFYSFVALDSNIPNSFTATYLAQEGLEIIKNIRDNNFIRKLIWSSGLTICGTGCQADYKTGTATETFANRLKRYDPSDFLMLNNDIFYSYDAGVATKFRRKITITHPSADTLKVDVQVFWDYNSQPFSFSTIGYLYNWY